MIGPDRGRQSATPVALVTGGGSGIGRAIALALAHQGMRLCLAGRRRSTLEDAARSVKPVHLPVLVCEVDLSSGREVRALADILKSEAGALDVLIHCAGEISLGPVDAATAEDFDRLYRTNVRAPYLITQLLLPLLRERRGQVVFINSSAGLDAHANTGQYAATKHALRAVADALREEVNGDGIRVTSVYVGRTATPMQESVHAAEGRAYYPERLLQPEDVAQVVTSVLSLPRTAEVTDVQLRPMQAPSTGAVTS